MNTRIKQLQQKLKEKQATACFLTNQKNIYYLTGFIGISPYERESTLLVTTDDAFLCVPDMYTERAQHVLHKGITLVRPGTNGLFGFWNTFVSRGPVLCESGNLTLKEFEYLKTKTTHELTPIDNLIESLRLIKDEHEIKALRKAAKITDATFTHIQTYIQQHLDTDLREHDIIEEIRRVSCSLGSEGFGFDPIVAVGPGSAEPHYISINKRVERGQALLIDMGFIVDGYTSDFTRTLFLGEPDDAFTRTYTLVQEAQQACLDACTPGVSTTELYTISREHFERAGMAQHYLHSLGHGVGLDIHEAPRLGNTQETYLTPGMIITIEPGLYHSHQFGVRIEDLVHITQEGCNVLTTSSKALVSLV